MSNEKETPNMLYDLKHEIGNLFCEYYHERINEKPTTSDREELQYKYARKAINLLQAKVIASGVARWDTKNWLLRIDDLGIANIEANSDLWDLVGKRIDLILREVK